MSNITYEDKVTIEEHSEIPHKNKVTADDMNEIKTAVNSKQDTLVSGTSIKTINNTSLLGSGNITVGGGAAVNNSYKSSTTETYSCNYTNDINSRVINNANAIAELKSPGPDDYINEYEYSVGDIVIHDGKRYICISAVEEYTWWEDQKSVTEMTNNEGMISFIDEQFFINQIQMLWPDFEGGSTQAITLYLDEQGPVTITCPGLDDREQTFSSIETLKNAQGIYVEPSYAEQSCTFVVNLDACWAWIPSGDLYSLQETDTGKVWVNGKKIYRKVVTGLFSDATHPHNINNLDKIISIQGVYYGSNNNVFTIPSVRPNYSQYEVGVYIDNTNVNFDLASSVNTSYTFIIIIEYTKN